MRSKPASTLEALFIRGRTWAMLAGGRLRKLRPDEAWAAIERLAQYENEEWNDAFILDEALENQLLSVSLLICLGKHDCVERIPSGSITTWEDLTTRFLAQFFPPERTAKLPNDILIFQQHHGESLSKAWTHFKDLLQKCEIDRAAGGELRNKNTGESWEIIENLALYDYEGWDETNEFVKPVKAISTPQGIPKTPD
ncbi:zinc finger, CCHC-type containing protein [Tanacetum coccineum]